jgi:hypothetical protein
MKNLLVMLVIIASMFIAPIAFAQDSAPQNPEKVYSVPEGMLTETQKAQLKAKEVQSTVQTSVETAGKYAGIGKEIGDGLRSALSALNEETNKFGNTKVGIFVMVLIAWKVMGTDVLQLIFGTFFALIWIPLWSISFFKMAMPRSMLASTATDGTKRYEVWTPDFEYMPLVFAFFFVGLVGLNCWILFA